MLQRILRVIRLDETVFAEIERDEAATGEAFIIVLLTSFLSALGAGLDSPRFFGAFISDFLGGVVLSWLLWSVITLWVGTKIYNGDADLGEMLRCIGYANAPRFIGFLRFIPCVGWVFVLIGWVLSLIAAFFAIREALDLDTTKTIATVIIGWIVSLIVSILFGLVSAGTALTWRAITGAFTGR